MTDIWQRLDEHGRELGQARILDLFAAEPNRLMRMSVDVGGLHFDFSKATAAARTLEMLAELAAAADLEGWRARLFAGEPVNLSERRAATHTAERGSPPEAAAADAAQAHGLMRALVERVAAGALGPVRHVLHIGIGGSALGPALILDALREGHRYDAAVVSNIDGAALAPVLPCLDPATTLVVIVSKTFTTLETLTNAQTALDWLRAADVDPFARTVAVTAQPARAVGFGVREELVLPFAETVGGRYSLWSTVGVTAALTLGYERFERLLGGARAMDAHFREAPFDRNAPALAAALDVLNASVLGRSTRAVFPYDERLRLLPDYLQQLEMESNGKRVTREGETLARRSAPVTWGGTGTDAQHAVFQLLHQGTDIVPAEFIAVTEPGHELPRAHHRQLLANCFAQGAALLRGRTREEALALSGGDDTLAAAKTFPGNRPSTTILLDRLDAETLGALLAFYEHRTFAAAALLGINPFDQWGVELGKEMAKAVERGELGGFDPSTADLLRRARI